MSYRLGVDLGTTFTAAAVANGGPPVMLGLGNRALQVPSVLYLPPRGDTVVGEAAERRGVTDPSRVVREFKRRIGDHVPILVAGVPYSPQMLTAQLLRWVVRFGTEQMGEPPTRVILTYPANWGPYKREILDQVVELADVGDVTTCSEPEAAAIQYAAKGRVQPGARIAMYDLGGGTFDTCVLEKRPDGFAMLGEPIGIEHLGGIDFDDAVFQHVLKSVGDAVSDLDPADPDLQSGLARLRRDCVEAKEALSSDVQAVIPVTLPGRITSVRLTRSELEELIRPPLEETVTAVGRAIRSAGVEPSELHAIVLVGGGSRIPLVRELLQQTYPVQTALDTHPKHDVALGAVQVGTPSVQRQPPAAKAQPAVKAPPAAPAQPAVKAQPAIKAQPPINVDPPDTSSPTPNAPLPSPTSTSDTAPATAELPTLAWYSELTQAVDPQNEQKDARAGRHPSSADRADDGTSDWLRRHRLLALALIASGVLILVATIGLLTRGDDETPAPTPSQAGSKTPAAAKTPAVSALPASTALTAQQLLVPMKIGENTDIYLADAQLSAPVKRLTSQPGSDTAPALSPDRRSAIYVHIEGKRTLRVMAVDGTGDRALFAQPPPACVNAFRPAWNPVDPTMLAIACEDGLGNFGLYLVRTNGQVLRKLPIGQLNVDDPAFSPDGRNVAYWAGPESTLDGGSIYTIPIDGGKPQRLTEVEPGIDADPAWSPNGTYIAFRRRLPNGTDNGNFDIFVVPADGSEAARTLIAGIYDDQDPSWSPAGDQLAIKSNQLVAGDSSAGRARVWLVKLSETTPRLLWTSGADGEQSAPAWTRR